jgi:hypothetical protein
MSRFLDFTPVPGAVPLEVYRRMLDDVLAGRDPNRAR